MAQARGYERKLSSYPVEIAMICQLEGSAPETCEIASPTLHGIRGAASAVPHVGEGHRRRSLIRCECWLFAHRDALVLSPCFCQSGSRTRLISATYLFASSQ